MLKEKILKLLKEKNMITFSTLEYEFPEHFDNNGLFTFNPLAEYNIWLWTKTSEEMSNTLAELIQERKMKLIPVHPLVYIMDGKWLNLPVATEPDKKYEEPRWLPVAFILSESPLNNTITKNPKRKRRSK